jgi:hypothetical protein
MPIYYRLLREEIARQAPKVITPKVEKMIEREFDKKKKKLMERFEEHKVTQELEAGAEATSSFLKVGNLFSLLGFYADEKPVDQLREILNKDIYLDKSTKMVIHQDTIEIQKQVWMPSQEDIREKTSSVGVSKWTDRSWLDMIERGIPGLPWFLSNLNWQHPKRQRPNFKTSRSGTGLEVATNLGRGATGPIKYISELMRKFRESILGR